MRKREATLLVVVEMLDGLSWESRRADGDGEGWERIGEVGAAVKMKEKEIVTGQRPNNTDGVRPTRFQR